MSRALADYVDRVLWLYCRYFPVLRGKMRLIRAVSPRLHRPGETRICRSKYGYLMRCAMSDWIQWQIYYFGDYLNESRYARLLRRESEPGDTFVDVGAHVGYYALLMSRLVGETGRVFAFEPCRATYDRLMENLALNRVSNVVARQVAISDRSEVLTVELPSENDIGRARVAATTEGACGTIRSATLDACLADVDIHRLRFLKMDVEGYELKVLQGALDVLEKHRPTCLVEIRRAQLAHYGASPEAVHDLMASLGYRGHRVAADGTLLPSGRGTEANLVAFTAG